MIVYSFLQGSRPVTGSVGVQLGRLKGTMRSLHCCPGYGYTLQVFIVQWLFRGLKMIWTVHICTLRLSYAGRCTMAHKNLCAVANTGCDCPLHQLLLQGSLLGRQVANCFSKQQKYTWSISGVMHFVHSSLCFLRTQWTKRKESYSLRNGLKCS